MRNYSALCTPHSELKLMSFNPTLPVNGSRIVAAELRDQFNGLKAIIDDLKNQLAALVPVLARDNSGNWTLAYALTAPDYWQIWARNAAQPVWYQLTEVQFSAFPLTDADMTPGGAWWQVKMAGENDQSIPCTPFSNVVSVGPVPA